MKWTIREARDYLVAYHHINTTDSWTIEDVFNQLKCIQFDPLNVVGLNPELVLQSRVPKFHKKDLYKALYEDRYLVDGWEKQMCIYQSKYIPHFHRVREERALATEKGLQKYFNFDVHEITDEAYQIIKEQGPIFSKDIHFGEHIEYYWSKTKTSTVALDYLFHEGKIGVHSKKNTQKKYSVMEDIYPNIVEPDPFTTEEEATDFYLLRRIESMGLIRNKSGYHLSGRYIYNKSKRTKSLERLIQKNLIKEVTIDTLQDTFYIPTKALHNKTELTDTLSFIAPLDNLIWDRTILLELFDFDYIWEVYTPKAKRKWGYYVLPMLYKSDFVGRIEFEKHRLKQPLRILTIKWEDGIKVTKKLQTKLDQALKRFASYVGASSIIYPEEE